VSVSAAIAASTNFAAGERVRRSSRSRSPSTDAVRESDISAGCKPSDNPPVQCLFVREASERTARGRSPRRSSPDDKEGPRGAGRDREHTELVEYVQEERSIQQRREARREQERERERERENAPAWRRAKWWLLGRSEGEA
jgi:hypothetical protein